MPMRSSVRKLVLTTHVTSSVGWLGAVSAFLALAVAGLSSGESEIVRAAYVGMHLTTWYVIVPLGLASFLTGIVEGSRSPPLAVTRPTPLDQPDSHRWLR
jgi:hypothetical protein